MPNLALEADKMELGKLDHDVAGHIIFTLDDNPGLDASNLQ
jgi:hypothetical protein